MCSKETVIFSTHATALGTTPQYQWFRNNLVINNLAPSYTTDSLRAGDSIRVIATSSERCLTTPKAPSNAVAPKVNLCNGVLENFEKQVFLFPNPSTETRFTLSGLDFFSGEKTVSVFNAHGQIVFSKTIKNEGAYVVFDLKKSLSNGFYWVKIAAADGQFYKKWVLER